MTGVSIRPPYQPLIFDDRRQQLTVKSLTKGITPARGGIDLRANAAHSEF